MEKEIIRFESFGLPIKLQHLNMQKGKSYRGMHSHVAIEIVLVNRGKLFCHVDNDVVTLDRGQIIIINSNKGHMLSSDNADITYFHIDFGLLNENENDSELSKLYSFILNAKAKPFAVFSGNGEIKEILQKINEKSIEDLQENKWYIKAYLYELVAFMYANSFISSPNIPHNSLKKIEPIIRYIDSNYKMPITLDDIVSDVKYNKYTVCHLFKETTGSTVFDYINYLRIQYAIERLKQKNSSILEVSTECGFSSATYFCRVFKNVVGCAPSVYRKHFTL